MLRARDGGSTHVRFWADGGEADAYFPIVFGDGGFMPGNATLTLGNDEFALERTTESLDELDGRDFVCLPAPPNGWRMTDGDVVASEAEPPGETQRATLDAAPDGDSASQCASGCSCEDGLECREGLCLTAETLLSLSERNRSICADDCDVTMPAQPTGDDCTYEMPPGVCTSTIVVLWPAEDGDQLLLNVGSSHACDRGDASIPGGWYFDDPECPTHVVLCPDACAELEAASGELSFQGCPYVLP